MMKYNETIRDQLYTPPNEEALKAIRVPMPMKGDGEEKVYQIFKEYIVPHTAKINSPRFWGYVIGAGSPYGMLNDMAISGLNSGSVLSMHINHQAIDWIKELLEYPKEAGGVFVVGGSEANFTGLAVARNAKAEIDMKTEGMQGVPRKMTLYCSEEGHECLNRSAELLGIGNDALRWIKTDDDYRIVINALKSSINEDRKQGYYPFCVIGNAGTVNSGAFDDLNGLADYCRKENLWFHVDGAFGGWVKLSEKYKHLADGLERADSVAVDLHKWMNMPYSIGCALVKDRLAHFSTYVYGHDAGYLKTGMEGLGAAMDNILNLSLALSRPDYGTKAYLLLRAFGRDKYSNLVQQNIDQMHYLAELVKKEPNMELTAPVVSNIVCLRYCREGLTESELEKLNRMILSELWKISLWMISDATIKGKYMLRACNVNNRTRREDFDYLVNEIKKIGAKLKP